METKTFNIISYCEIAEHLPVNHWLNESPCGHYRIYDYDSSSEYELDIIIKDFYPDLESGDILIDIDY